MKTIQKKSSRKKVKDISQNIHKKKEVISLYSPPLHIQLKSEALLTEEISADGLWNEMGIETTEKIRKLEDLLRMSISEQ